VGIEPATFGATVRGRGSIGGRSEARLHDEAVGNAVVATDLASANADCDNGAVLRSMRGARRGDGTANRRLATTHREESLSVALMAPCSCSPCIRLLMDTRTSSVHRIFTSRDGQRASPTMPEKY
jgi:hypothetical protein